MKFVPNAVSSVVSRKALLLQKASPQVLFVAGVTGFVATTVLVARSTLKVESVLENTQSDLATAKELFESNHMNYSKQDYDQDRTIIYVRGVGNLAKLYTLPLLVGVASITCLTGAHNVLNKRNAGLAAAYAAVDKGFKQYRSRVIAELGEDKDREFRYEWEEREFVEETKKGPKVTTEHRVSRHVPSMYSKFFDEYSKNWSRHADYNFIFLRGQQRYANDLLQHRGHVFLNEVYESLGLEHTAAGAVVGWVKGHGDDFIDFGLFDGTNERARDFVNGREGSILLDFNVDGVIYDLLKES